MRGLYDLMLMLDPDASEERRAQIVADVESTIASGGKLVGVHDWGMRRLAYKIDHRSDAAYHLFQFEGANDLLDGLNHKLKISDGVLRFRTIRLKPGSPPPPTPRPEPSRRPEQEESEQATGEASEAAEPAEPAPETSDRPDGPPLAAPFPEPAPPEADGAPPLPDSAPE